MASRNAAPSVTIANRSAIRAAVFMADSEMPNTGHDAARRASFNAGSLNAAMMIASTSAWRSSTTDRTAGSVSTDWETVSISSMPEGADNTSSSSHWPTSGAATARIRALVA